MIVIADDDPLYDDDLKTILGFEGWDDVTIVATGEAVLQLVRGPSEPQAIVLDMMLPWNQEDADGGMPPERPEDLGGLRVAKELKEVSYDLRRVVVITAFHNEKANALLRDLGIEKSNILLKPARTTEILWRIRRACEFRP